MIRWVGFDSSFAGVDPTQIASKFVEHFNGLIDRGPTDLQFHRDGARIESFADLTLAGG